MEMFDEEYDEVIECRKRGTRGVCDYAGSVRGVRELGVRVVFCREDEQRRVGEFAERRVESRREGFV